MDPHMPPSLLAPLHRLLTEERRRQATDRDLLQAFALRGEHDAFAELLRRHGPMVLNLALHLLHHRQDAEDVFQATFLMLARKARSLRCESSVAAWLHRVAWRLAVRSRAASKRRAAGVRRLVEDHQPADAGRSPQRSPTDEISLREAQELLHQELAALPERLRLPLVLCYLQGRTRDEAARRLGWSLATLKRRLEQGRKLLHVRLSRRGVTLPAVLSPLLLCSVEVPASLMASTVGLAASSLAGSASLPASVALLLAEASSSVKAKAVWGLVLTLGACAGAAAWVYSGQNGAPAAAPAEVRTPSSPPTVAKKEETPHPARDLFGDPLPAGVIARLGTVRLRHANYLREIAFAPDGKTVVSVGVDGVRVWETAAGKQVRHFGAGVLPRSVSLSTDGKYIALARYHSGLGGPVDVWDVATGKLLHKLGNRHYSLVRFTSDGKRLATLSDEGDPFNPIVIPYQVEIWDAVTGQRLSQWKGRKEYAADMGFSKDGQQLLLGGSNKTIWIHDAASGKEIRQLDNLPGDVHRLLLSPRGDRVACIELNVTRNAGGTSSWGSGERVFLIDLQTGAVVRHWTLEKRENEFSGLMGLAFSPDGNRLAACQMNGPIRIWNLDSDAEFRFRPEGRGHSGGLAFSPDGRTLAVGNGGRVIRLLDAATGADRVADKGPQGAVTALAVAADGRTAYTAAEDGTIHRWDAQTGRELGRLVGHKDRATNLALLADGQSLCSRSWDHTLRLWDVNIGKDRLLLQDRDLSEWSSLALSPDGKTLAIPLNTKELLLLDPIPGKRRHWLATKTQIFGAAFTADGSAVMALTGERKMNRWETATGRRLPDLALPLDSEEPAATEESDSRYQGECLVLSPDGRWVAHAFDKKFLRLLDVSLQRQVQRTANLPDKAASIVFAPDGWTLAWAEESGIIHWLELATWSERRTFSGHAGAVNQMGFTNDGKRLISGSEDTTTLVWDLLGKWPATLSVQERDACWTDLADKDAAKAYRALCRLIAAPVDALTLLRSHLKPSEGVDEKRVERLVADLDSDAFAVREKATKELRKLGELAEPACRKALAARPALEMSRRLQELLDEVGQEQWRPSPEILRQLRAIEVLERLSTPEARRLLETLAAGAAGARQTREASAALQRLRP